MFTLWYSLLSWRELRHIICDKLSSVENTGIVQPQHESNSSTNLTSTSHIESRIPISEPPQPITTLAEFPMKSSPPISVTTNVIRNLSMPIGAQSRSPRSPSPHPMKSELFGDDIEYDSEETEEDEEENSVIDSSIFSKDNESSIINNFLPEDVDDNVNTSNSRH